MRGSDRYSNSHRTSLGWMLLLPCHLPGLRRSLPRTTGSHLTPGVLSSTSSGRFLGAILLRHASESDVTEEIQIERTSADGRGRSLSRILTARDPARAHKQVSGSSGSMRVHAVELLDLGGLVHGQVVQLLTPETAVLRHAWLAKLNGWARALGELLLRCTPPAV